MLLVTQAASFCYFTLTNLKTVENNHSQSEFSDNANNNHQGMQEENLSLFRDGHEKYLLMTYKL